MMMFKEKVEFKMVNGWVATKSRNAETNDYIVDEYFKPVGFYVHDQGEVPQGVERNVLRYGVFMRTRAGDLTASVVLYRTDDPDDANDCIMYILGQCPPNTQLRSE